MFVSMDSILYILPTEQLEESMNLNNEKKQVEIFTHSFYQKSSSSPAVVVAIKNRNGEFLLLCRTSSPCGWCLAGGKIDDGEDELTAAIREVREETGLDVRKSIRSVGNSSSIDGRLIYVFVALVDETKIHLSENEHTAYMWVNKIPFGVSLAGNTKNFLEMVEKTLV